MNFSDEVKEKIRQFAREQSQHYLEDAEMTYLEKLHHKVGETKSKLAKKLAKLRSRSNISVDVENDLVVYMSDLMRDLMESGVPEQEAFERAKEELKYRRESDKASDLKEKFAEYYERLNPADYEAIGLFYGGFLFIGLGIGTLIGFIGSGGRSEFLPGGWLDTLIGAAFGAVLGIGLGLFSNAIIALRSKR